jgi:hypothetical protein
MNKKLRSCDGRKGAQRPVSDGYELKKTGARSERARTRGQNPLVSKIIYKQKEWHEHQKFISSENLSL